MEKFNEIVKRIDAFFKRKNEIEQDLFIGEYLTNKKIFSRIRDGFLIVLIFLFVFFDFNPIKFNEIITVLQNEKSIKDLIFFVITIFGCNMCIYYAYKTFLGRKKCEYKGIDVDEAIKQNKDFSMFTILNEYKKIDEEFNLIIKDFNTFYQELEDKDLFEKGLFNKQRIYYYDLLKLLKEKKYIN